MEIFHYQEMQSDCDQSRVNSNRDKHAFCSLFSKLLKSQYLNNFFKTYD